MIDRDLERETEREKYIFEFYKRKMEQANQFPSRQDEASDYLEQHKIFDLLANLTSQLVFNKPGYLSIEIDFKIK